MADNQKNDDLNSRQNTSNESTDQEGSGRSYDYGAEGSGTEQQSGGSSSQNTSSQSNNSNSNSDHQNASANRGGTTDMGSEILTGPGQTGRSSSTQTTKRNVTGSDYDGQVSQ